MGHLSHRSISALNFCLIAGLIYGVLTISASAQTGGGPPPVCDAPPNAFRATNRRILNRSHGQAIALVHSFVSDKPARAQQLAADLRDLIDQVARQRGLRSPEVMLLSADLADLMQLFQKPDMDRIGRMRQEAFTILSQHMTPEAVEVSITLDASLNPGRASAEQFGHFHAQLQRHRSVLGESPNARPLWSAVIDKAPSPGRSEQLARDQLMAAITAKDARWLMDARSALLDVLIRVRTGRRPDQLAGDGHFRGEMHKLGARGVELVDLARALNAEHARRVGWDTGSGAESCQWMGSPDTAARVLIALGSPTEGRQGIALAARHAASGGPFGADIAGALTNISAILALRSVDRGLYREAMRTAAPSGKDCELMRSVPEVCGLATAAGAFVEIGSPRGAIVLFADAVEFATEAKAPDDAIARLLVSWAELEWRYGTASDAHDMLVRADRLAGKRETDASIKVARLRAILSDVQLDDDAAQSAFQNIVDAAKTANKAAKPAARNEPPSAEAARDVARIARDAASELTVAHMRGRFCSGCGDPGAVTRPAADWIEAIFDPNNSDYFFPSHKDFLLLQGLSLASMPPSRRQRAEDRYRETLRLQQGTEGNGAVPLLEELQRLQKSPLRSQLVVLALSQVFSGGGLEAQAELRGFHRFLVERDVTRKRAEWKRFANPIAENNYENFGASGSLYADLDSLARAATSAGYGIAGRVVFEYMLDRIAEGASTGNVTDARKLQTLKEQAVLAVPALARLAVAATAEKEWIPAHRLLDLASTVIREKLGEEWRVANDRAASSLNDLRGAARLIAQTRARLVSEPSSHQAIPDGPARLFTDLQLAMLSETALVTQAADRRRVAADPVLASAIARRDEMIRRIAAAEQLRYVTEQYGLTTTEDEIKSYVAERDKALGIIRQRLPISEDLVSASPLSLAEAERKLVADEALLVLHAGSDGVYGFLKAAGRPPAIWFSKIAVADLERRIEMLRAGVTVRDGSLEPFPFMEAAELYTTLLGPAKTALSDVKHLLVVSDGPLQSLSLSILLTDRPAVVPAAPDEIRTARLPWLVRRHAVTILTSARSLAVRNAGRLASRARFAFAGFGNPVLAGIPGSTRGIEFRAAFRSTSDIDVDFLRRMPALPDTETEIRTLGRALNARPQDLMLGPDATEKALKLMPLADYRVLTFATHGLVAGRASGAREPGLVLTPPEQASTDDDGYLSSSEIANLKLDADLVILSACNTAASNGRPRAEGLSGLARSFLSAGARSVLASHWAVPTKPTLELTTRLLPGLAEGSARGWGRSLQVAMLAVADDVGPAEYAHPANWGAFASIGLSPTAP